jgi:C4-type Zn-finger protein
MDLNQKVQKIIQKEKEILTEEEMLERKKNQAIIMKKFRENLKKASLKIIDKLQKSAIKTQNKRDEIDRMLGKK